MNLEGKRVALFVADLFEDLEFWYPRLRLQEAGASITVIGPEKKEFTGKHGLTASSDQSAQDANPDAFDILIIPGGYAPDHMRRSPEMVTFVRKMHEQGNVVAAICHGPWMLASADIIRGKRVTSFFSLKDDVVNAGGKWEDSESVQDGNIITSRKVEDLPAFCKAIINATVPEQDQKSRQETTKCQPSWTEQI